MENLFIRAFRDTTKSYGLTLGTGIRSALVPLATFFLVHQVMGGKEAMSEGMILALSALAAVGAGFLPLFLWNLWLAPYKILKEEIDKKDGGITLRGDLRPSFSAGNWNGIRVFQLGDAACLWAGVRPHKPIDNDKALAIFKRLSGAMMRGEIPYNYAAGLRAIAGLLEGKRPPWPEHSYPISAIDLRKYADATNDVPRFLRSVEVPPNLEPETDSEPEGRQ